MAGELGPIGKARQGEGFLFGAIVGWMLFVIKGELQVVFLIFMQASLLLRKYFLMVQLFLVTLTLDLITSTPHSFAHSLTQRPLPCGLKRRRGWRDRT